jgi:hypothetical protein
MAEELGKIEKPLAADYIRGRKLYFVPLLYETRELPAEYLEKLERYWQQVEEQIGDLELKLGQVHRIYHEFVSTSGEEGLNLMKDYNQGSCRIAEKRIAKGCCLEAVEDAEILAEFMDWQRCIIIGLQSRKVLTQVYENFTAAGKQRNETIAGHIDATLKEDETGILFMREGHTIQFPPGIEVFYIAPPMLDEINRWLRDREASPVEKEDDETAAKE